MLQRLLKICAILCLSSCQYFQGAPSPRAVENNLSQEYAELRKAHVSDVTYNLNVDLTKSEKFKGEVAVSFNLKEPFFLTLDFAGGEVLGLKVNQQSVEEPEYNGFFLEIPSEHLVAGANTVVVQYSHPYSSDGTGLHRYKDPVDQKDYLYTNFEPYNANRFFPCFDQPDLKASFTSKILAPNEWIVVSSNREESVAAEGPHNRWTFPKSDRFSTYTFSVHAGAYKVWEEENSTFRIPLRLMARQSMAKYVDPAEWFALTRSGFDFFEKYFSSKYPYKKYDQLIVPEYNHGAMENVAAVTFNEDRFISRGEKTHKEKRYLALVLYHEMAHMWFGNLVTMQWWDDLWLNESFATYSSYVGVSQLTDFKDAWSTFHERSKQSAYRLDKSVNTHPIATPVASTGEAFSNFDSITYGKGASVLKQLAFYLGESAYRRGLKSYFKTYAHGNTKLHDFIEVMEKASKKDLQTWTQRWIDTEQVNDMEAHVICQRGRIKSFEIFQTATQKQPMLRTHKTKLALLRKSQGRYKIHRNKEVIYSGGRTLVSSLKGSLCPDIVFPNYMDYDYATVTLDKRSLKNIQSNLVSVDDTSLRMLLWSNLWQMTLDQKLSAAKYLEIAEFNGIVETDVDILNRVLENVSVVLAEYYPTDSEEWKNKRTVWVKFFEQAALTRLSSSEIPEAIQKVWFKFLTGTAESNEVLKVLSSHINGRSTSLALNFALDQDSRWAIIGRINQFDLPGSRKMIASELKRDPSTRGKAQALFAQAVRPDLSSKKKILDDLLKSRETARLSEMNASLSGLLPAGQDDFKGSIADTYYRVLRSVREGSDRLFARSFSEGLDPSACDADSYKVMRDFVRAEKGLPFDVVRRLKGLLFENRRCQKIREKLKKQPESYQQINS